MKKRNLLGIFTLALVLVLTACGGSNDSKKSDSTSSGSTGETQSINLVMASEPPTLDPQVASDTTSGAVIRNVFEGLTKLGKDNRVDYAVAESSELSDDGKVYTFKLRDSKWSNGDTVVAGDFEYAWKRALNPEFASEAADRLYVIKGAEEYNKGTGSADDVGVKAIDDKTLEVTLNNPTPYFLELTAFYTFFPVNEKVVEANAKWAAEAGDGYVSNGPFTLSEWQHDNEITLAKNDNYWDKDNVSLSTVSIKMVEDQSTANKMFEAGEIDYLGAPYQDVSLDYLDVFKKSDQLKTKEISAIYMYKVNTTKEIESNANIRKALALSINRADLIKNVTKAGQKVALGMVPPTVAGFEEDRGYFKDNDIEGAKEYLKKGMEELGISDASDINLSLSINTSEQHSAIAQYVQEGWQKNLGIKVEIDNSEWQVFLDKMNELQYDGVGRMGWFADFNDPITFLSQYRTPETGNNQTGWGPEAYKELIDESTTEVNVDKRLEILKEAEKMLMDEMPVIPVFFYSSAYVHADTVKNMEPDTLGVVDLKTVSNEK